MVDLPIKMTQAMKAAIGARAKQNKKEVVKVAISKKGKRSVHLGLHDQSFSGIPMSLKP